MSLFSRITNLLGRHQPSGPSTLRNCPGGMAWVRGVPADYGAEALNGRVVKTVRINELGSWDIEPVQTFACTASGVLVHSLVQLWPGKILRQTGIDDIHLEPIRNPGDEERDESLSYLPPVPGPKVPAKEPA